MKSGLHQACLRTEISLASPLLAVVTVIDHLAGITESIAKHPKERQLLALPNDHFASVEQL